MEPLVDCLKIKGIHSNLYYASVFLKAGA